VDEGGDDQAPVYDQRGENFVENARRERFDFYSFGAHRFGANGNWHLGASPTKSARRFKTRIGDLWCRAISIGRKYGDKLNRSLRGCFNRFVCAGS
jgi:hypothetical protein